MATFRARNPRFIEALVNKGFEIVGTRPGSQLIVNECLQTLDTREFTWTMLRAPNKGRAAKALFFRVAEECQVSLFKGTPVDECREALNRWECWA